ncbi:MAG TPA: hypothetical protein DHW42_10065 [Candidatus Marinimicrobia bacterium]|nr:hypothetical protein [Candidatus Neomarinimicrobiota bacterium]
MDMSERLDKIYSSNPRDLCVRIEKNGIKQNSLHKSMALQMLSFSQKLTMKKLISYPMIIHLLFLISIGAGCDSKTNHYYIDGKTGNDANTGLSIRSPWKSLQKLQEISFQPGDQILFAKNSAFQGGIFFESSGSLEKPIVVSSYGEGAAPSFSNPDQEELNGNVFQISGSHIVIDGLSFVKCADANSKHGKSVLEAGAIFTKTGANYITVKNCVFIDCPIGINITGQHSLITGNTFKDCNRFLNAPNWGPLGIVITNAYNEISFNSCSNYVNIGGTFGADGGFIELDDRYFGTQVHDIKIHHNTSFDNMGFLEIETQVKGDNIDVYYNLSDDYQQFIFFWGGNNSRIENNTVIRTKPPLNGAVNTVFTMRNVSFIVRNNIFVVANGIQVFVTEPYDDGNYDSVLHEYNLYSCSDGSTDDPCGIPLGTGEIIADPRFINIDEGDYQLDYGSPAIDRGMSMGYQMDLNRVPLEKNGCPDMGAYERKD